MITCKLCGYVFSEDNLEESIETHLRDKHFLSYQDYYEIITLGTPSIECWKCGSPRYSMSPYLSSLYLPCPCCVDKNNKQNIQDIKTELQNKIRDYQNKIQKSKYLQYLLSISPAERSRLLPKSLEIQSDLLLSLKQNSGVRLDKSSVFKVVIPPGRSTEISERNLEALEIQPSELKVEEVEAGVFKVGETGCYLSLPEVIPFDQKHHSRGSILNPNVKRLARKLKLSGGECIKFWNPTNLAARSILRLTDGNNELVSYQDLSMETKWLLRFSVLKTKPILTRVFEIYSELFKYVGWIDDSVFLLNSFDIPYSPQPELGIGLVWSWEEYDYTQKPGYVKLSIL